jgi:hypothetical protein
MLDTATRGKQLAAAIETRRFEQPIEATALPNVPAEITRDSWGNPYCVLEVPHGLAVVSAGATAQSQQCIKLAKRTAELERAQRPIFESAAGEIILIDRKR